MKKAAILAAVSMCIEAADMLLHNEGFSPMQFMSLYVLLYIAMLISDIERSSKIQSKKDKGVTNHA